MLIERQIGILNLNMATCEGPFQQHFLPMVALGRVFRLGDLYNYCNDNILSGIILVMHYVLSNSQY